MNYESLVRHLSATGVFRCDQVTYALGRDPMWIRRQLEDVHMDDLDAINETSVGNLLYCFQFAMESERQIIGACLTSMVERIREVPTGYDSVSDAHT